MEERKEMDSEKEVMKHKASVLENVAQACRRPGDLLTLGALLRHSSLRLVMRYAHPFDEHRFEAIRSMDDVTSESIKPVNHLPLPR